MEAAAEIMETSADEEQTVAGTEAFEPDVGDLPRRECGWYVIALCLILKNGDSRRYRYAS